MKDKDLIEACKRGDAWAQKRLYERYVPVLFGLSKRYVLFDADAEDIVQEAMYKILTKISSYGYKGSFEGWMRKIAVNEALMFLRKKQSNPFTTPIDDAPELMDEDATIHARMNADELLKMIRELPTGYRLVFNMFVIEGYKHREIAEILGISIHTSKSQLILAKKKLRKMIDQIEKKE